MVLQEHIRMQQYVGQGGYRWTLKPKMFKK